MNYEVLFKENFKKVNQWLDTIAKRNNKDCNSWCDYTGAKPHEVICNICNNKFDETGESVWFHGYNHLKKHNLLPFI